MINAEELNQDVFYAGNNQQFRWQRPNQNTSVTGRFHNSLNNNPRMNSRVTLNRNMYQRGSPNVRFPRAGSSQPLHGSQRRGRNPLDSNGQQSKCAICQSINHWAHQCPDANTKPVLFQEPEEVTLFEGDLDHPQKLKSLVAETLCAAVLDCGASKTCCGTTWWNDYAQTLDQCDIDKIEFQPSNKVFQFGGGDRYQSLSTASFPATIGGKPLTIIADIISADIPLLLSKDSLKKAGATIDFTNDTAHILNETVELIPTKSGHYAIPITPSKQLLSELSSQKIIQKKTILPTILTASCASLPPKDLAHKLHRQFAHPPTERLVRLVTSAGEPWNDMGNEGFVVSGWYSI